jgi:hypothetical protein
MIGPKKMLILGRQAMALLRRAQSRESAVLDTRVIVGAMIQGLLQRRLHDDTDLQLSFHLPLPGDAVIDDCPLGRGLTVRACVARQLAGDPKENEDEDRPYYLSRHDGKRGTAPDRPHCVTARCPLGARIRAACGDGIAKGVVVPDLDSDRR